MNKELYEKVKASIGRIEAFEPQDGYFLAYSGGKDSTVLLELAKRSGVKFDAHYHITTVDPPELVRFVISQFDAVVYTYFNDSQKRFGVQNGRLVLDENASGCEIYFDLPETPMRKLIPKKKMPPTRLARYCCQELKEVYGVGRVTMTGVRWDESSNRRATQGVVSFQGKSMLVQEEANEVGAKYKLNRHGDVILNDDNDEARRMVEICYRTHKTLVNPIVDWTDQDVWDFIKGENIPYCKLYDEGFKRLGCIGCPLGNYASQKREFKRYPAFKKFYIDAFADMLEVRINMGRDDKTDGFWKDADSVFKWWTGGFIGVAKGQISIDDILEGGTHGQPDQ